jgi:hypothetical protein
MLSDWLEDREPLTYAGRRLILLVGDRQDGKLHWLAFSDQSWLCDAATTGGRWPWAEERYLARWRLLSAWSVERD